MSLWLTDVAVRQAGGAGPPDERRIAEVLTPVLRMPSMTVHSVIDGRPPALRTGSTANYRLQRALGLPRAAPVACWSPDRRSALATLELLLDTIPDGACALLVAGGTDPPHPVAVGLVWRKPAHPGPPLDPAGRDDASGNGFLHLLTDHEGDRG